MSLQKPLFHQYLYLPNMSLYKLLHHHFTACSTITNIERFILSSFLLSYSHNDLFDIQIVRTCSHQDPYLVLHLTCDENRSINTPIINDRIIFFISPLFDKMWDLDYSYLDFIFVLSLDNIYKTHQWISSMTPYNLSFL